MGVCEKTKSTFYWCTWRVHLGRMEPSGKHSSGYYPGELPQPSKASQHSNSGNTEDILRILLEKRNPKIYNRQIYWGWNEENNIRGSQRERSDYPQREVHQTNNGSLCRSPRSHKRVGAIFNIHKEKNFQPSVSYPSKLSFISEGGIKSFTDKQMLMDFVSTMSAL